MAAFNGLDAWKNVMEVDVRDTVATPHRYAASMHSIADVRDRFAHYYLNEVGLNTAWSRSALEDAHNCE